MYSFVYLAEKYERRGNCFMTWKVKAVNGRQMRALDYTYTIIWLDGPTEGGEAVRPAAPQPLPEIAPEDALPTLTKTESQEAIDRYSVLTRGARGLAPTCTRTPSSPAARSSVGPPTPASLRPPTVRSCSSRRTVPPPCSNRTQLDFKATCPIRGR